MVWAFGTSSPAPSNTFFNSAMTPNPFQTVPPTVDLVFKHMNHVGHSDHNIILGNRM